MRHIDLKPIEDQPPAPESEFALEVELRRQRIKEQERLAAEQARANVIAIERAAASEQHEPFQVIGKIVIPIAFLASVPFMYRNMKEIAENFSPGPPPPPTQSAKPSTQAPPPPLYTVKDITPNLRYYELNRCKSASMPTDEISEAIDSLEFVLKKSWDFKEFYESDVCVLHVEKFPSHSWDDQAIDGAIKAAIAAHGGTVPDEKQPCAVGSPENNCNTRRQ